MTDALDQAPLNLWYLGFYQRRLFPLEHPSFQPGCSATGTRLVQVYNEPSPADELELGRRVCPVPFQHFLTSSWPRLSYQSVGFNHL